MTKHFQISQIMSITTTKSVRITLSPSDIAGLLDGINVPPEARFWIQIPGGADYSGERLELSKEIPVIIEWEEKLDSQSQGIVIPR
jgi:hypothetical protein